MEELSSAAWSFTPADVALSLNKTRRCLQRARCKARDITILEEQEKYTWFTDQAVHAAFLTQLGDFTISIYFILRLDPR